MNSQITTDLTQKFADEIRLYLRYNEEYRTCRNPNRKQLLKTTRNAAYHNVQQANAALHTHLIAFKEPDFLRLHARKLIELWDARNTCYQNLINRSPDDTPAEAITRLNRAEKTLKTHLKIISEILQKIS